MEILFETFSFRALWTPELFIPLFAIGILYFLLISRWRSFTLGERVPLKQRFYFVSALVALYLGWGSPLYIAGHIMISFHMAQMVLAYFVAVPLFLLGIPSWMFRTLIERWRTPATEQIARFVWSPIVALFLFNGLFSLYHVPFMFDTLMQNTILHSFYEYGLFLSAALMWWHMIAPLPNMFPLSDLRRIGYIFANGILITPACALIIFAPAPLYQTYIDPSIWASVMAFCLPAGAEVPLNVFAGPDSFRFLEPRMDQQLAGVFMKIAQELMYGFTIGYVFKQWLSKEKQQDGELTISDVPVVKP
ncbi:cytochrome c oxidase assembly factor CtaG [Halalkalibacter oceani]|uniref:cytochrome c oxidase assembly factor CtaG n=1 Tax=Halalkalibacter oceani TaxID=1653776 RepID=UPI0033917204